MCRSTRRVRPFTFFLAFMALLASPAIGWSPAGAQTTTPVPDSIAHPIVLACGDRLDPPAFVRAYVPDLAPGDSAALAALETELRRANEPLGRRWHEDDLDQEARAEILAELRANYQQWWTEAQPVLGTTRVATLLEGSTAPEATPAEARCPFRSAIAVVGLVPGTVGPGEAMAVGSTLIRVRRVDCTYDQCALRIEGGRIVRGAAGVEVGRLSGWDPDIDVLLTGPVQAAAHARRALEAERRANLYGVIGGLGTLAFFGVIRDAAEREAWDEGPTTTALLTVGLPLSFGSLSRGLRHQRTRQRAIARSLWTYNRQFSDAAGPADLPLATLEGAAWDWAPVALGGTGALIGLAAGGDTAENALIGSGIGAFVGYAVATIQLALTQGD